MSFFAYVQCRPDGTPFYVGKGSADRVSLKKRYHNAHQCNVVDKYGRENILVGSYECSSEQIAYELERGIIKRILSSGAKLTNLSDGGEGAASGAVRSTETRLKMAAGKIGNQWNVGRKYSKETCIKKSRSLGGTRVIATNGNESIQFDTVAEACRSLSLDRGNVTNHLNAGPRRRGVKGWFFERVGL